MNKNFPRPTGELQGDSKPMPDRGTSTGMMGNVASLGANMDMGATNRRGGISGTSGSHEADCCPQCNPDNKGK